ncbi:hypothetical protein EYC84_008903 [Monilinia fructicola]|uniref:Uncharacterized protein n=1 Tax=Monilinia fructicola TaxID=38448 RepID=A0A5M9JAP6_MONFR|nr:hypothetical protein EYC84_008903 [Monilinia fructicola]
MKFDSSHSHSHSYRKRFLSKTDLHCYQYQASNAIVLAIRAILCGETFERNKKANCISIHLQIRNERVK